jgi:hypothetical protein
MRLRLLALLLLCSCGDNLPGLADAQVPDAPSGLPYVELPTIAGYNHASETLIAAGGNNVVVVTTDQFFPSADSFVIPTVEDPAHPFRKVVYATSHDRGETFTAPRTLVDTSCTDPLIASSKDGSFWGGCNSPDLSLPHSDLLHSTDGGNTFSVIATPPINDKGWIAVDDARQSVWIVGSGAYRQYGFDGTQRSAFDMNTTGISSSFADAAGLHLIEDTKFQIFSWNGIDPPVADGSPLPAGNSRNVWTTAAVSMGSSANGPWVVRAIRDNLQGSPILVRVRQTPDGSSDVAISPPGTIGFLPAATLDDQGRLHAVWYDSSGPTGRLMYARSTTTDLLGSYTTPVIVDGNACPGDGWYPYEAQKDPPGGRRLREYIGIAITGNRAVISWTHAPDAPSRVRVAHLDF